VTRAAPSTLSDLPADAEALRALVRAIMAERDAIACERDAAMVERDAVRAERDRLQANHDALAERAERLDHLLRTLRRLQFGRKSERLPEAQLHLGLEDTETAVAKVEAEAEHVLVARYADRWPPGSARRRPRSRQWWRG